MIYSKAKKPKWANWDSEIYFTRKDRYHKASSHSWALRIKKPYRKISNRIVRRYNGEISDGCVYKKLFDLRWTIF